MTRWQGLQNSLFYDAARLVIVRLPRLHFPGHLSTHDADLAEHFEASTVQPVKILIGRHGFAAIRPHYRRDRNFDPAVVTSQTVNFANHGPCPNWSISGGVVAQTGSEKVKNPWCRFRAPGGLIFQVYSFRSRRIWVNLTVAPANAVVSAVATGPNCLGSTTLGALGQVILTTGGMPSGSTSSTFRWSWLIWADARGVVG